MLNKEYNQYLDAEFAGKCRKALETSYGTAIPLPKCIVK
jgi:hypothetical protein